jgi:[acyl-carrier-protein] S-malonyltransferase
MKVFLFPGQGSQEVGMAADLFKADESFRKLIRRAGERTGSDLEKICLRGPERELIRTRNLQPLLVCVSLGYLRHLMVQGIQPDQVIGHSLGEISALAAAGCVSFETAVDIAAQRGEFMEAAAARCPGGMLAVISSEREAVLGLLARQLSGAPIVLANDNAPGQLVFSGELAALEQLAALIAAEKLGQSRRLVVAGPWHSPLMAPARQEFSNWLETVDFQRPRVPLILNATAAAESDPQTVRQWVARNLVEPVRWRAAMAALGGRAGLFLFEIGPGRVLSGLARANGLGEDVKIFHVNNLRGVEMAAGLD